MTSDSICASFKSQLGTLPPEPLPEAWIRSHKMQLTELAKMIYGDFLSLSEKQRKFFHDLLADYSTEVALASMSEYRTTSTIAFSNHFMALELLEKMIDGTTPMDNSGLSLVRQHFSYSTPVLPGTAAKLLEQPSSIPADTSAGAILKAPHASYYSNSALSVVSDSTASSSKDNASSIKLTDASAPAKPKTALKAKNKLKPKVSRKVLKAPKATQLPVATPEVSQASCSSIPVRSTSPVPTSNCFSPLISITEDLPSDIDSHSICSDGGFRPVSPRHTCPPLDPADLVAPPIPVLYAPDSLVDVAVPSGSVTSNMEVDSSSPVVNADPSSSSLTSKRSPPPFTVPIFPKWQETFAAAQKTIPSFRSKLIRNGQSFRLFVNCTLDHSNLVKFLESNLIPYRSHLRGDEKPLKVVIRGIPTATDPALISSALASANFEVLSVTPMFRGPKANRIPMPLFYVQLAKTPEVRSIFQLSTILCTEVSIERYRGTGGPSQCHNCQGFFHSAARCKLPPRCVICAEAHHTSTCPLRGNKEIPCTCCNCGQVGHPASYRKCPRFPKFNKFTRKPGQNSSPASAPPTAQKTQINVNSSNSAQTPPKSDPSNLDNFPILRKQSSTPRPKINWPPKDTTPNMVPPPSLPASATSKFLPFLFEFELVFSREAVLTAFRSAFPALEQARCEIHQIFLIYEELCKFSNQSD